MAENTIGRQIDRFVMNNCKIANELRKYRDLSGCVNQVSLSSTRVRRPSDAADYAEYFISEDLSYMDMVVANAAYTLMSGGSGQAFQAETIARLISGSPSLRIGEKRRADLEARLTKLAGVRIQILADHDHQVERDLYEGAFLPISWSASHERLKFRFLSGETMPLYQYAADHRQLLQVPLSSLREEIEGGENRRNNTDRSLLLRHYLLQELEILKYPDNKVTEQRVRLLKRDPEGHEMGLLWVLGIIPDSKEASKAPLTAAQTVQRTLARMLDDWQKSGLLQSVKYQMLPAEEGFGVWFTTEATPQDLFIFSQQSDAHL